MIIPKTKKCIILFDGECSLCNYYVQFVINRIKKQNIVFVAMKSHKGKEILKKIEAKVNIEQTILLIENDKIKTKSDAILEIIRKLKFPYNILTFGYIIPRPFRDKLYQIISKNRHRIFKNNNCEIDNKTEN